MSGAEVFPKLARGNDPRTRSRAESGHPHASIIKASEQISEQQVKALTAAAGCLSFSRAASVLHMSQPAFSKCIKDMEQALGCELFTRTRQGVLLTAAGAAFLPHARSMVEAYDELHSFVAARRMGRRQTLRVAASLSIGPVIQAALLRNLQAKSPGAALQLSVMNSGDVLEQVASHRVEFGLCGDVQGDGTGNTELRCTPVLEAQLGLIVPSGCALPERIRALQDLSAVPMVRLADAAPVTGLLRRAGLQFPAYFNSPMVFSCLSSAMDLMRRQSLATVGTGIGASLLPAQDFRFVPLPDLLPRMIVHLVSARRLSVDDELERLRDVVRLGVHDSPWHTSVRRLNLMRA